MDIKLTPKQAAALKTLIDAYTNAHGSETPPSEPVKPVPIRWRAEENERYFYVYDNGAIAYCDEKRHGADTYRYKSGNYYKTKEEAEQHERHQFYTQKLKDAAAQAWLASGMLINWKDERQVKYSARWQHTQGRVSVGFVLSAQSQQEIYFPSEQVCVTAYKNVLGNDLKWYMTFEELA